VGEGNFTDHPEVLARYGFAANGTEVLPRCVVYPTDKYMVRELVLAAIEYKLELYPISRGKNFGYGEAQGTKAGQVILDLSRMDKILAVDNTVCYATIEPGVSQQKLSEHLQNLPDCRLQADMTGAGTQASLLGNYLERGFGHSEYGNRFEQILNLEVVLPTGEIVSTGLGAFPHANAKFTYRYGLGPVTDGLFSQSNMGIVTSMTIALKPKSEKTTLFVFSTPNAHDLETIVEVVRELRLKGLVNSAVHIANRARVTGNQPAGKAVGEWNLSGAVTGSKRLVKAKQKDIEEAFSKAFRKRRFMLHFINENMLRILEWVHRKIKPLRVYEILQEAYQMQQGVPSDQPYRTLFDQSSLDPANLDSRNFPMHFQWVCAVAKACPSSVRQMVNTAQSLFDAHGYEFRVTLTALNPRNYIMISNIAYGKDEGEKEKALAFFETLVDSLAREGFYPYRSGSGMYGHIDRADHGTRMLLRKIKQSLDPHGIIAPGKYNIG
jgi:4-cresol dehydrogenase (hydroxylating)